jgi:lysophospholipase L1-like esterase
MSFRRKQMLAAQSFAVSFHAPGRAHERRLAMMFALVVVLAALAAALLAPSAGARPPFVGKSPSAGRPSSPGRPPFAGRPGNHALTYLALGDSLAFGYSQAKFNSLLPAEPASAYDTGYVDDFGKLLGLFEPGVQTVNDGCPGETTESFIKGPCAYGVQFPLHHPYSGSQLADALSYLGSHPGAVNPITIDIGANDALGVIEGVCKLEAKCVQEQAPALFVRVGTNLALILGQLRAAAPTAKVIVLGLYNPFGESITGGDALTAKLNEVMAADAAGVGARFANPLPVFNPPGALEQSTLCTLTNICTSLKDIHPTDLGYAVLGGLVFGQYLRF